MKTNKQIWSGAIAVVVLGVWLGIPTFNKWQADKLVDELCAKDGGIKVYEVVTLPKERFNQWGQFEVRDEKHMKSGDEYYSVWNTSDIEGKHNSTDISVLTIYKHHIGIYRARGKEIIGEAIAYVRRSGDPIGPWHPSSHSCPENIDTILLKSVFLQLK